MDTSVNVGIGVLPLVVVALVAFVWLFYRAPGRLLAEQVRDAHEHFIAQGSAAVVQRLLVDTFASPGVDARCIYFFGAWLKVFPPPHDIDVAVVLPDAGRNGTKRRARRALSAADLLASTLGWPIHLQLFRESEVARLATFLQAASPLHQAYPEPD